MTGFNTFDNKMTQQSFLSLFHSTAIIPSSNFTRLVSLFDRGGFSFALHCGNSTSPVSFPTDSVELPGGVGGISGNLSAGQQPNARLAAND